MTEHELKLIASGVAGRSLTFALINSLKASGVLSSEQIIDIYDDALGGVEAAAEAYPKLATHQTISEARKLLELMARYTT